MEALALAIFLCFIVGLLEYREARSRRKEETLKELLALNNFNYEQRIKDMEAAARVSEQSFLELKEIAFRSDEAIKLLVKAHESKMSGDYRPPAGDHTEEF